jgi:hypothetical protein
MIQALEHGKINRLSMGPSITNLNVYLNLRKNTSVEFRIRRESQPPS